MGASHYAKATHVEQTKTRVCIRKCKIFVGRKRGNTREGSHSITRCPCESVPYAKVFSFFFFFKENEVKPGHQSMVRRTKPAGRGRAQAGRGRAHL